ncbi:DEAD/DEAH box helicase family protein [Bacillaceae bacterium IKA-2]|nr:DEAD/DEAH box helicase family protein [Bacillaceae bacterium IKA-2]
MENRVSFQFDPNLDYQMDAVRSVVDLFKGLPKQPSGLYQNTKKIKKITEGHPVCNPGINDSKRLLDNLRWVQLKNHLFADDEIQENNFTIEMETGTGKTYVYLRTILELHQEYRFRKFIIVVPSIAIRKGIEKSIEMLTEHFKALYDIDIKKHSFIYDSKNRENVSTNLVKTKDLSICVMNIQAFNKDTNKIRQEDEYGQILWEDIKYIRPIVIIDEPQKIEGTVKQKSAALNAIEGIEPLFTLRYSATHKQLYNQIYKLDSYAAFKKNLVKKIEVKTVHALIPKDTAFIRYVQFTKDLKARVEIFSQEQGGYIKFKKFNVRSGASLYELSGQLPQYRNMRIHEDPHKLKSLKIATGTEIIELLLERSTNEFTPNEVIRIQIRLAIKSHLDKQFQMLDRGEKIKVLSLFFIDSVVKVRDPQQRDGRGEYLRIFDDEYTKIITEEAYIIQFEKHKELFPEYKNIHKVREGYFARDKNNKSVDIEDWDAALSANEIKVKAKSQEDIDRGIELILEKKDELISFQEPLAFIISHSALREGWDNPNVFTLCTLKSGGSDIAKKQEIGRGLRLPVDSNGNQRKEAGINELTIITNDTYDHFAEVLQKDFNESISYKKNEVTAEVLFETLRSAEVPAAKVTSELVNIFKEELKEAGITTVNNILTANADQIELLEFMNETLHEHCQKIRGNFVKFMIKRGTNKIPIRNGNNEVPINEEHHFVSEEDFLKLFQSLANKTEKHSLYKVNINKDLFIQECTTEINDYLQHMKISSEYIVTEAKNSYSDLKQLELIKSKEGTLETGIVKVIEEKSEFEKINYIMYHTMLPRLAILKIIRGLNKQVLLNNQDILDQVTRKIEDKFKKAKAASLYAYEKIAGYDIEHGKIFELDDMDEEVFNRETSSIFVSAGRKALSKHFWMDSSNEFEFVQSLENNPNVLLFTKLSKAGFVIDTPDRNYSPDWALVCRVAENKARLFFIVEIKKSKKEQNLSEIGKLKIKCEIQHFEAVSNMVTLDWVKDYQNFKNKFAVKDTI